MSYSISLMWLLWPDLDWDLCVLFQCTTNAQMDQLRFPCAVEESCISSRLLSISFRSHLLIVHQSSVLRQQVKMCWTRLTVAYGIAFLQCTLSSLGAFLTKAFVNEIGLFAPTKAGLDVSREVQIKRASLPSSVLKPNFLYLQESI